VDTERWRHQNGDIRSATALMTPAPLPIDAPERRRLPVLLRRAWYGLNQAFRRSILPLGLTPDQFTVLRTLLENPGITQRKLAELMSSDPNTVAALVARVEKMGLVERQTREKDRRAHSLRLLRAGKEKYEAARKIAVKLQTEILSELPPKAREDFLSDLNTVAGACRRLAEQAPQGNQRKEDGG
jgi:DNA-binding MarR family transcriptional regulator